MKKVIIEQSGQESIVLNAPEGASVRIDDGVAIVEPKKYTPKVGDCVKLIDTDWVHPIFFVCGHVNGLDIYEAGDIISHDRVIEKKSSFPFIRVPHISYEKITPEELQAEFNKLGYEYDFETHTAKVWKPKNGEKYCCVTTNGDRMHQTWSNDKLDNARFKIKNVFHPDDKEGFEKYVAHIKSFER